MLKSVAREMKANTVTTWAERPTIMMFLPRSAASWSSPAVLAIAPPADCRTRAMTSQGMKIRGYHLGGMREFSLPKTVTMRERVK